MTRRGIVMRRTILKTAPQGRVERPALQRGTKEMIR